ncbi:MAG: hypothetical protein LBK53_01095 [Heliobacteriaceae bacterium]|jgi:hypothetical protein|nr:hypothetical protein [Heliobacteriaceae bacterium]
MFSALLTHHPAITRFLYAMGGVAVSVLLLFVILYLYKKIFIKGGSGTLNSVDEAVIFFINKNKLE